MNRIFSLEINLGNSEMNSPDNVSRALKAIARRLEDGETIGGILDANGNHVGMFGGEFDEESED